MENSIKVPESQVKTNYFSVRSLFWDLADEARSIGEAFGSSYPFHDMTVDLGSLAELVTSVALFKERPAKYYIAIRQHGTEGSERLSSVAERCIALGKPVRSYRIEMAYSEEHATVVFAVEECNDTVLAEMEVRHDKNRR